MMNADAWRLPGVGEIDSPQSRENLADSWLRDAAALLCRVGLQTEDSLESSVLARRAIGNVQLQLEPLNVTHALFISHLVY